MSSTGIAWAAITAAKSASSIGRIRIWIVRAFARDRQMRAFKVQAEKPRHIELGCRRFRRHRLGGDLEA